MIEKQRLGVLVSGGGSNLQSIIDSCESGVLKDLAEVVLVISNKEDAYALTRAEKHAIEGIFIGRKQFSTAEEFCCKMCDEFQRRRADILLMAGFLSKLEGKILKVFENRILNIHPALLPKYGGKGMYGHFVHEAVLKNNEKVSGATVHIADECYDQGKILVQKEVAVLENDTPDSLAKKILEVEHKIYPEAVKLYITKYGGSK